jgi:hypothetical protein
MINFIKQLFKPGESRYDQLIKLKGYSENNIMGLPESTKFEYIPPKIEFDLTDKDVLVIHSERMLTDQQRDNIVKQWEAIKDQKGRVCLVLDAGMTYSILHRTP